VDVMTGVLNLRPRRWRRVGVKDSESQTRTAHRGRGRERQHRDADGSSVTRGGVFANGGRSTARRRQGAGAMSETPGGGLGLPSRSKHGCTDPTVSNTRQIIARHDRNLLFYLEETREAGNLRSA